MKIDWDVIEKLAKNIRHVRANKTEYMREQLEIWWSVKFNRPLKDPLLKEYNLYELLYEYLVHFYMDPANDPAKQEEEKRREKDDIEWVQKMMANINKPKAEGDQGDTEDKPKPGTEGMFVKPSPKDIPFPDLPDTISSKVDE